MLFRSSLVTGVGYGSGVYHGVGPGARNRYPDRWLDRSREPVPGVVEGPVPGTGYRAGVWTGVGVRQACKYG